MQEGEAQEEEQDDVRQGRKFHDRAHVATCGTRRV
jgi:hypothetical protein